MADIAAHGADTRPRVVAGLRLLSRVGSGGEGEVWEARDPRGASRALKLIRPEVLPPPEELARRGAYLQRIAHPALVRVHRSGRLQGSTLDGWGFLEMEFVEGEPLGQAPADPSALDRLETLAEGLDALHRGVWSDGMPLVHRDVKPANLIARPSGEVVLVDCSTLRGTDATHLTRIGTPVFAAPEVLSGRVGPPADVYSFAATLVALVTGARGEALARLLAQPERLDLPEAVGRALSPDPAARPRSCRAVLHAGTEIDLDLLPPMPSRQDWGDGADGNFDEAAEPADQAPGDAGWGPQPSGHALAAPGEQAGATPSDGWEPEAARPPGPVLGWMALLACCAGLVWAATMGREQALALTARAGVDLPPGGWSVAALLAAVVLHVVAVRAARQGWAVALLAPPVAWAWLLGERTTAPGARRAWARTALTGALCLAALAGAMVLADAVETVRLGDLAVRPGALAAVADVASVVVPAAARAGGIAGMLLRALLVPAWLAGAVLLLAAALGGAPLAILAGRGRWAVALATGALAGAAAFAGIPGRPHHRQAPDPRA